MNSTSSQPSWLERPVHPSIPAVTNERLIFAAVLLVALVTRLYNLGARVMSHDESLHTYFSWLLYKGDGYQHNPMMHGPLQFHLIALSYFLFGPSDFSARLPAALFNVATIILAWHWRRYLGKTGGLIAGILMVISPIMLFYGRYVREDPYAIFSGVLMLYVVLRYLEGGERKYLYTLAVTLLLHFIDKETAFMYTAELLIFLAVYFVARITRQVWEDVAGYRAFLILLALGILLMVVAVGLGITTRQPVPLGATEVAQPANPSATASPAQAPEGATLPGTIAATIGLLALTSAGYMLVRGYTWQRLRSERSFDLLMLTGTLVLPMLVPFALKLFEMQLHIQIPTTTGELQTVRPGDVTIIGAFLAGAFGLSIALGQLWRRDWWKLALAFWVPFTVFYTTIFTNTDGFFTGVVGSLGYWLVQQGVQRGSQPWYYYLLVLLPIYEFLPLLGSIAALVIAVRRTRAARPTQNEGEQPSARAPEEFTTTVALLTWWIVASIGAFSYAGEKMPWLTYHLTWPLILFAGWGIGWIIDSTDWQQLTRHRPLLVLAVAFVLLTSLGATMIALFGSSPPFQGKDLVQLEATTAFLLPSLVAVGSAIGLLFLLRKWTASQVARVLATTFFGLLAILTARAAFRAAYVNYDNAMEYLVYAHASAAVKDVIRQAAEISHRTTGGMGVNIAYDASAPDTGVSWPFVWYLRDFTAQHSFDQPTRALRDSTIVIVDAKNFDKIEQALGSDYFRFDYIRMWWPNQDYFGVVSSREPTPFDDSYSCRGPLAFLKLFRTMDFSRVCSALEDPKIRAGIIDIWLNRDFSAYAAATGHSDLTLSTWQPSDEMRMYIKKDVVQQMWKYGIAPSAQTVSAVDPYQGKIVTLSANPIIDASAASPPMNAPRQISFAPDGTFYVADSRNARILHFDVGGRLIEQWGTPSGNDPSHPNPAAPPATFNEPWGVAVGPDGSVYVTDTWNYRVQKFSGHGQFINMWSSFGPGNQSETFYGPRGITVDPSGHVYVVDTGNKRVVEFDANGAYLGQFGSGGLDPGQFDEPVGIAIDAKGVIYLTDTWNQRIQSVTPSTDGVTFTPLAQWDVVGWSGQSLDNKPFIAVDDRGHVFVTDPEGYRVIEYSTDGELIQTWGDYGNGPTTFGIAAGIAVDGDGSVWVTDAGNNRIMKFVLP